jgi:hypothetical protein
MNVIVLTAILLLNAIEAARLGLEKFEVDIGTGRYEGKAFMTIEPNL